jgi:putative DNA methylase
MASLRPDLKSLVGQDLTVIAWLWARTVKSPNPAFASVDVPLASSFMLSTKLGKEAYVEPVIDSSGFQFTVKVGRPKDEGAAKSGTKLARGANFKCLMSGTPIAGDYIKAEGMAGRMGARMMAIVAEGPRGRVYLAPTFDQEAAARRARPDWKPVGTFVEDARAFTPFIYGLGDWQKLFTDRQLVALATFSDLVGETIARIDRDARSAGLSADDSPLANGGTGAQAYAEAVTVYLAFLVDQVANHSSSICGWNSANSQMRSVFARQALAMTWDFAESNPLCDSSGSFANLFERQIKGFETLGLGIPGIAEQADANRQNWSIDKIVSTDPPYFDNVPYADLSDFFYVWLRRSLRNVFPALFSTISVPKTEELVAFAYRHKDKVEAEVFFLDGMTQAMHRLAEQAHPAFPVTIYYAFKQAEDETETGASSTGWETFLDAVIRAGFATSGTWPMRTEKPGRVRENEANALASSIIIVCRPRAADAPTATRRDFVASLRAELPAALRHLQAGNIAPVDLAQAVIGPGMGIYTRYSKVLGAEGKPVSVREALALINATVDEALAEQEGDFDADSRWAVAWFDQFGFAEAEYGIAETLSKAKNTSVAGLVEAGILDSRRGKVRLLRPDELPPDWDPNTDPRLTAWETVHHLVRVLDKGGEAAAAELVVKLGGRAESARGLAYRLYALCERKKRASEALAYNGLVQIWPEIIRLAREAPASRGPGEQADMFESV